MGENHLLMAAPIPGMHAPLDPCHREGSFIRRAEPLDGVHGYEIMEAVQLNHPGGIVYRQAYKGRRLFTDDAIGHPQPTHETFDVHILQVHIHNYNLFKEQFPDQGDDYWNMIAVLQHLQPYECPNIANLVDCLENEDSIYIVTEYGGIDLFDLVESPANHGLLHEDGVRSIFAQIVNALIFLQEVGIYHQDFKMENIVMNEGTGVVKLIDFGMAVFVPRMTLTQIEEHFNQLGLGAQNPYPAMYPAADDPELQIPLLIAPNARAGSLPTIPPERISIYPFTLAEEEPDSIRAIPFTFAERSFDAYKADNWPLGFILLYLLTGGPPWTVAHQGDFRFVRNCNRAYVMEALNNSQPLAGTPMSEEVKDLVSGLLSFVDPTARPTLAEILAHPWLDLRPAGHLTNITFRY